MRYFIDGYNLLFKEAWGRHSSSLELARKTLIEELDSLAQTLRLDLIVVFDAPLQSDDIRRGHYNSLEIIFTARGQTADEYLVEVASAYQKGVIVVTSDRGLAYRVKGSGAQVESVHDFIAHLRKKWRNKLAKQQKAPLIAKTKSATKKEPLPEKPLDMQNLPPLSNIEAWEKIFTNPRKEPYE